MSRIALQPLFLAALLLLSAPARASALPPLDNYLSTEIGPCRISSPPHNAGVARELAPICKTSYARIFRQLGQKGSTDAGSVEVRVVGSPAEMKSVTPKNDIPPPWAVALAYPEFNLVVLSLNHGNGSPVLDLATILEHELSHLALQKTTGGSIPKWFSEGVAIHQSEKSSLGRYWFLWTAVQGRNLLPLDAIEHYPERAGQIDLAYAEAADFLAFLLRREGWLGVRVVLRRMAKGKTFDVAFAEGFGDSPAGLEAVWLKGLTRSWQWAPVLTGTGTIWGFIVVLFLVAYATVRRREKRRLKVMEEEEQEAALDYFGARDEENQLAGPRSHELARSPTSTKIRIDGDIYTLH